MPPRLTRAALLLFALLAPAAALAAEVVRFTPDGTIRRVRQVTARFSESMVPLGDPRGGASDPFEIDCAETGSGRWVDSRTWVYDFARDLPAGIRCRFRLRAGLTTLAGAAVTGRQEFGFSTGGPAILSSQPNQGHTGIEEDQAFLLVLDSEATDTSLLSHVGFAVEGLPERVGVRLVTGADREAILRSRYRSSPPPHVVILQARQRFPNRAKVSLVWGKGVSTPAGVATDQDQVLPFQVRGPFTARFTCERENPRAGCIPVAAMSVEFTGPVAWEQARRVALVGPTGQRWTPKASSESAFTHSLTFEPPFPELTTFRVEVPSDVTDETGRPLANASAFPLTVRTEAFPPLAKFAARFGIIEAKADASLPVTVRNLEPDVRMRLLQVDRKPGDERTGFLGWVKGTILRIPPEHSADILPWLRKVATADREASVFGSPDPTRPLRTVTLPRPGGAQAFEVVGIPLGQPGLYIVELESQRLGASLLGAARPMYVPTAALVTNLAVHWKWGRERSLAWVTALDSGQPVRGARVTVYDCQGTARAKAETDGRGIAWVATLPLPRDLPRCPRPEYPRRFYDWPQVTALESLHEGLFVMAQTADDLGFVHSNWERGIESWRFQLPGEDWRGPAMARTVFDRPLFRAGETVHMKHVLRLRTLQGLAPVPEAERPVRLQLRHVGSNERYELPVRWDAAGTATGDYYGLALDQRLVTPASLLPDTPLEVPVVGGLYRPRNYDETFRGLVPVRTALASSLNVPAVRTLGLVGPDLFVHQLRRLGFAGLTETGDFYGPALALGSADVSLWELVGAYRSLAEGGMWRPLRLGPAAGDEAPARRVYSPEAAFLVADILAERESRSATFGLESPLATRFWTAVKTGTSKEMRDNWCVGFSARYTVGVWVGNFSGAPMRDVSGVTGAAPVWRELMAWLHLGTPSLPPRPPAGVVRQGGGSYLAGTEPAGPAPLAAEQPRILAPAPGTVIALDPDIPPDRQRVVLEAEVHGAALRWRLDGEDLGPAGEPLVWAPVAGRHAAELVDEAARVVALVGFEVRGLAPVPSR